MQCAGEKLTKEETKALMKELCDPADDDGFMPFKRKYNIFLSFAISPFWEIATLSVLSVLHVCNTSLIIINVRKFISSISSF